MLCFRFSYDSSEETNHHGRNTSTDRVQDMQITSVFDDHLPDEVLFRIFVHLPTKAVYRYRCVSKRWLSLLSDSKMASLFFSYPIQRPFSTLLFDLEKHKKLREVHHLDDTEANLDHKFYLDFILKTNKSVVAAASYNDFILFHPFDGVRDSLYLCNIFTKQWIPIPRPPSRSDDVIGLLPDRVVCVCNDFFRTDGFILMTLVFKFSEGMWRGLGKKIRHPLRLENSTRRKGLACNGKLYWLTSLQKGGGVLVYDPSKTGCEIGLIRYPIDMDDSMDSINYNAHWFIGECRGKLRISKISTHKVSPSMNGLDELVLWIWELEDNHVHHYHDDDDEDDVKINNSWCLKCKESLLDFVFVGDRISLQEKHKHDHAGQYRGFVRGFHPYDGDIVYFEFQHKFVVCNLQQRTFRYTPSSGRFKQANLFFLHHPWFPTPLPSVRQPHSMHFV